MPPLTGKRRLLRPELAAESEPGRVLSSAPALLLAEVERLTRELDRAQSEVRRLEVLADEDPLCGVLNRRGFDRAFRRSIAHAARYGAPASLLLLDLDDFKTINDRGGHLAGDASFGLADLAGGDAEVVFRSADEALYAAKRGKAARQALRR